MKGAKQHKVSMLTTVALELGDKHDEDERYCLEVTTLG